eukprot:249170-Pelagomonas_calceolata.AAC.6
MQQQSGLALHTWYKRACDSLRSTFRASPWPRRISLAVSSTRSRSSRGRPGDLSSCMHHTEQNNKQCHISAAHAAAPAEVDRVISAAACTTQNKKTSNVTYQQHTQLLQQRQTR